MKTLLLAGVALTALVAGPAMAADLPVRAPVYKAPPPVVSYFSWSGCYVGGNVGGLWAKKDWSISPGDPFLGPGFAGQPIGSHDPSGWLGGVQAGCNYQVGGWVFGIQGDYDWASAEASGADVFTIGGTISSKVRSLSSVTGRVGYAWDRFLGYVKGGGAWERDEYTATCCVAPTLIGTGSETRSGWTVGIGGEYAFTNNLTAFIEYDWYGFGTKANTLVDQFGTVYYVADIKENKSVLKIGLNWKFGKGPVVANY